MTAILPGSCAHPDSALVQRDDGTFCQRCETLVPRVHAVINPKLIIQEPLTQEWREEHVRLGDEAIAKAASAVRPRGSINAAAMTWATIAQAHYLAANVRAKAVRQDTAIPEERSQCSETTSVSTPGFRSTGSQSQVVRCRLWINHSGAHTDLRSYRWHDGEAPSAVASQVT